MLAVSNEQRRRIIASKHEQIEVFQVIFLKNGINDRY